MNSKAFFPRVYAVVQGIPKGKVLTYGDVAWLAGSPLASRAVGMAMKHNPDMTIIPCHRVVASNGALCGYSAGDGISTKMEKLQSEGVFFRGNKVDLKKSRWRSILLHVDLK